MKRFLSNLPKIVGKKKKRLGRGLGSGRGSKSGRGTTRHQKARENIPLHFEGGQARMVKKFPLLRGKGKNKSRNKKSYIIKLRQLNVFKDGEEVTAETLIKKGLIESSLKNTKIKLLNGGVLNKKLIVKLATSKSAKISIENAGGKIV